MNFPKSGPYPAIVFRLFQLAPSVFWGHYVSHLMILYILYKEKLNPTVESFLSYFLTIYGPFWTFYNQLSIWFPLNNNNPLEEELRRSSKELLKLAPPHHLWYVAKEDGIDKKCKSSMLCSSIPTTIGNPGAKKVQQHLLL